jgi:hypothetical protein
LGNKFGGSARLAARHIGLCGFGSNFSRVPRFAGRRLVSPRLIGRKAQEVRGPSWHIMAAASPESMHLVFVKVRAMHDMLARAPHSFWFLLDCAHMCFAMPCFLSCRLTRKRTYPCLSLHLQGLSRRQNTSLSDKLTSNNMPVDAHRWRLGEQACKSVLGTAAAAAAAAACSITITSEWKPHAQIIPLPKILINKENGC